MLRNSAKLISCLFSMTYQDGQKDVRGSRPPNSHPTIPTAPLEEGCRGRGSGCPLRAPDLPPTTWGWRERSARRRKPSRRASSHGLAQRAMACLQVLKHSEEQPSSSPAGRPPSSQLVLANRRRLLSRRQQPRRPASPMTASAASRLTRPLGRADRFSQSP